MKNPGFNSLFGPSGVGKTSLAKMIANSNFKCNYDIVTEDMDTILYSYNLERLPGWLSTGKHLNKVTSPENQSLKEQLIKGVEIGSLKNRINIINSIICVEKTSVLVYSLLRDQSKKTTQKQRHYAQKKYQIDNNKAIAN